MLFYGFMAREVVEEQYLEPKIKIQHKRIVERKSSYAFGCPLPETKVSFKFLVR